MNGELPKRGSGLPPRQQGNSEGKTQEEVISEAALKTNTSEQTNPVEDKKPWLKGSNLTEAELMSLTQKKSLDMPLLMQAKLDFIMELEKKKVRGFGQARLSERQIILEDLEKMFDKRLKDAGYNPK